jgi:hypothetical protein
MQVLGASGGEVGAAAVSEGPLAAASAPVWSLLLPFPSPKARRRAGRGHVAGWGRCNFDFEKPSGPLLGLIVMSH